ncbi:MAG: YbaK/EbsC family protein [Candidatus Nanopelagicales bacterium]
MNVREIENMHPNGQRVQAALDAAGVPGRIIETLEGSPTAATAAAQLDIEVGQVANSLVFDADGEPLLVLTSGQHKADTHRLAELVGAKKVHRPNADFVRAHTGQPIGGVAPCGHTHQLRTIVDTQLNAWPIVWAAGGHPHYVFPTSFDELVRITNGTPFDVGVKA